MKTEFNRADRTYEVSDERLRAFMALTPEQRLKWVEELAAFLRLAKLEQKNHHSSALDLYLAKQR